MHFDINYCLNFLKTGPSLGNRERINLTDFRINTACGLKTSFYVQFCYFDSLYNF